MQRHVSLFTASWCSSQAASCGERLFKELGRGCTEKKRLHTMKVFDYADKKKLLFGPLSWPTELPALGYVPKTSP